MKILSTPHAHTTYCDGKNTAEEMVLAAIEKGFVSLGLSEHGPQSFDGSAAIKPADIPAYIGEVHALIAKYAGALRLHLGIERDFYSSAERSDFDYVIGSFHYLSDNGGRVAADGELEPLLDWRASRYGGDGVKMACDFFRQSGEYARAFRPDIFGHFDLLKKRNGGGLIYDPENKKVIEAAFDALEMILESGALLELNTGGMARSGQKTPYPDMRYLKRWRELGGRVIVGSDCHFAPQLDYAFDEMPAYLRAAGFATAWRLGAAGEELFTEFPLDD